MSDCEKSHGLYRYGVMRFDDKNRYGRCDVFLSVPVFASLSSCAISVPTH